MFKTGSRIKFILLPLLLAAGPRLAAADEIKTPVNVTRDADGTLSLSGAACAALKRQASALSAWRSRLHETAGSPEACVCAGEVCSLKVSGAAPDFVNLFHGVKAGRWGPNCWNTALVSNKILAAPGFTSPEEMAFWMKSPLCRALGGGELPRPGDIIAIRDQAGEEMHGFVYLTSELSFSKNYLTAAAPYALQSPEEVYQEFPVEPACRLPGNPAPGCAARSDYFRCSSLADYLPSSGLPADADYAGTAASVMAAEKSVSDLVLRWKTDPELKARAPQILAAAAAALTPARSLAANRPGLLWTALTLRIDSLLHQISLI
jgi:hypothetical protein